MANKSNTFQDIPELVTPAVPVLGFQRMYGKNTGKLFSLTSTGLEYELRNPVKHYLLTANFVNTTGIRTNITGWAFNVVAGKDYKIEVIGCFTTATATTGMSLGFITSGAGTIRGYIEISLTNVSAATGVRGTISAISASNVLANSFLTSGNAAPINTPVSVESVSVFSCTTSGVLNVQYGSEIAGTTTLLSGSVLIVTELN